MQKIQLYIEGERMDMFDDESVTLTQSIQNIKDISKIFTDFSKTFSLPASKTNNKIFKHYYNFDISNGFDGRTKKDSVIELSHTPFKEGKIKLEGVDLKDNKPHTYRVTFFGSTVTLKDLLGEDKLQSLSSLTSENKTYDAATVRTSLQADPTSEDIIVPLITHTDRLTYNSSTATGDVTGNVYFHASADHIHGVLYSQLKYAIRGQKIIEAIESKYGITFSDDFFVSTNANWNNLFLWLHRKKGDVENIGDVNSSIVTGFTTSEDTDTLTEMVSNSTLKISGNTSYYPTYSVDLSTVSGSEYNAAVFHNGVEVYNTGAITGNITIDESDFNLDQGDYSIYIQSSSAITFSQIQWSIDYKEPSVDIANVIYSTGTYSYSSVFTFDITQQIPEMKIIDFLSGIFKMFNLTAYIAKNTSEIIIKPLDDFYATGISYDITKYIDSDSSSVDVALPYREINFGYEDTDTFLAETHNQKFAKVWGESNYTSGEKLDGSIYNIKIPFSHLKYERLIDSNTDSTTSIQYGYFVDDNQDSYFGKPLLFYPVRQTGGDFVSFLNSATTKQGIASYNIPSNSIALASATNTSNINFYNEINEYDFSNNFTATLFQEYYSNYITSVFNQKNRMTKVKVKNLPLRILLNYNLADRFLINDNSYKINSVKSNLSTGISELELINDL